MPIYDYRCRQCNHQFELLVLRTSPEPECPACQQKDLEQLISMFGTTSESITEAHIAKSRIKATADQKQQRIEHEAHVREHHH